jgi:4-oxalocrotonate tautomerase
MDIVDHSPGDVQSHRESAAAAAAPSRRDTLKIATGVAAAAATGISAAMAETTPAASFGAPLAELHFPGGVLTLEQKAAMIKGVSDVLAKAVNLPQDQALKLWVQIFETADGGWGAGGQVFVPRSK